MPIKISDKFYFPYSFSVDFGYSSKKEVEFVEGLLRTHTFPITRSNVLTTLKFVRDLANESREINDSEIQLIKKIVKEEKITGGFLPPEIQICYQSLELILLTMGVTATTALALDKFSGDRISKATSKAITKLLKNKKSKKLITNFKKKLKRKPLIKKSKKKKMPSSKKKRVKRTKR